MGTTRDSIRGGHPQLGFVLVIEGYKYLITTGTPSQATTAWSGTLWSNALPGLQIDGSFSQSLEPWSNELDVPQISFRIQPDSTDQFGKDMFRVKPSVRSELTVGFDTGDSSGGGFNITVKDADLFTSGQVYIGNEAFNVTSSPSGTTIPVASNGEGYFSPFGTNAGAANTFPGPHSTAPGALIGDHQSNKPVFVTDAPPSWIGKKVGLFVHRIADGVWDLKAQAEVWFAGTIQAIEEASDGATVLHCADIRKALQDTIVLENQFVGTVAPGFVFEAGDEIKVSISGRHTTEVETEAAATLTCVASGAGADQFNAGRYTAEEFANILVSHLNGDSNIGRSNSYYWSGGLYSSTNGQRFRLHVDLSSSYTTKLTIKSNRPEILVFLGYEVRESEGTGLISISSDWQEDSNSSSFVSKEAPFLVPPVGLSIGIQQPATLELTDSQGTFFDHTSQLPRPAQFHVGSGEQWSYFTYGEAGLFLGRYDSATQISGIRATTAIAGEISDNPRKFSGVRIGEANAVQVRQVVFLCDSFASLIAQLFASVDGNGSNHATYDTLTQCGAGIPWDLLGTGFVDSLGDIEASTEDESCALVVEKPMRLWDAIKSEFALRMAGVVWKDGGLQVVQFTVPNASTADHTLDETNKSDTRRTQVAHTDQYLCHTIKIEHNRNPATDEYRDKIVIRDTGGYQSQGGAGQVKTIMARNAYGISSEIGASVESLADLLASRFLPVFSRPVKTWTRSISHQHFHIAPGDTVTLSDDYCRAPDTGSRGITSRPCTVISVDHSFGIDSTGQGYFGSVTLMYTEEDRLFPLAPACEHANVTTGSYTNGWDAAGSGLLVQQHAFSISTQSNDSSHLAVDDAVRVTELDPADPASADSFTDTVASITEDAAAGYDEIELTNGFGAGGRPAFSSSKTYVVTFDAYDQVDAAGKLHTFQADDVDGRILDTIDPNIYGDPNQTPGENADLTLLPYRHAAEMYGDGEPVGANTARHLCRMVNNLNNYKTAGCLPSLSDGFSDIIPSGTEGSYRAVWTMPFVIGRSGWPAGYVRKLNLGVFMYSSTESTLAYVRVTSSANPPSNNDYEDANFFGPTNSVSFSTTSTTTVLTATQQLVPVRSSKYPHLTFLTIELSDTAPASAAFKGLAECWLGPLEAA